MRKVSGGCGVYLDAHLHRYSNNWRVMIQAQVVDVHKM